MKTKNPISSQTILRIIADLAPDAIVLMDDMGCVAGWNKKAEEVFGYSRDEIFGKDLHRFLAQEKRYPEFQEAFRHFKDSGVGNAIGKTLELIAIRKTGEEFPIELSISSVQLEGRWGAVAIVRDVSERKRIERDLAKQMTEDFQTLSALFNGIGDPIYVLDLTLENWPGKIIEVNDAICRLLGYSRAELLQMSLNKIDDVSEDVIPRWAIDRLKNNQIAVLQRNHIRKDGTKVPVELSLSVADLFGRKVTLAVARDMTLRLRAEEDKRKAERKYELVFESAADAIVLIEAETDLIQECNQASTQLFGKPKNLLVGQRQETLYPKDRKLCARRGGFETQILTANGELRDVSIRSNTMEFAGRKIVQSIFRDITERVKSERELSQTHAAIENSLTPMTVVTGATVANTRISYANPAAVKLWGYSSFEEFQAAGIFQLFSEKCHERLLESRQKVFEQGFYTSRGGELFGRRKDGTEFELACSRTLLRTPDGEPAGITSSWLDMSDAVRLEKEKAHMQAQLMHSSKLASIGTLAAGVAHEINNPMTIIAGNTEYLKHCVEDGGDKAEMLDALSKQTRASERIVNIVNGLRTFARADNDVLGVVHLRKVIEDTLSICEVIFRKERVRIERFYDPGKLLVEGNTGKLQQVILNLLTNAKDACHTVEGGGLITIRLKSSGQSVRLEISDNGCGIVAKHLPYIFDPFFTTKPQGQGTGLGLSIVYSIVNGIGGKIEVESAEGVGTKFLLTMKSTIHEMSPAAEKKQVPVEGVGGKVLVVDDEQDIRNLLARYLGSIGLTVIEASDGELALEILKKETVDYLITDLKMPQMNGDLLVKQAVEFPHLKNTRFIVITGGLLSDYSDEAADVIRNLVHGIIRKPFDLETVVRSLNRNKEEFKFED